MNQAAELVSQATSGNQFLYEQPLNERMRTFLRLEFLYTQLLHSFEEESSWASRNCISTLLDIVAILARGDARGDVLKELERQIFLLDRYQLSNNVDETRLRETIDKLQSLRHELNEVGPTYLQPLRDNEFLNSIRHRSAIPGGTCAFDLPDYTHWLRKNYSTRSETIKTWLQIVKPLCDSVGELLWLLRNSNPPETCSATNGVYQHALEKGSSTSLIRISIDKSLNGYPEISGSHHRFTVRFMKWKPEDGRPVQCTGNIDFTLTIC
ncbi:MAG: cell division protein ZapD [Gammaproteobacteria bacterium]|nr:cell division protein ZapD [Gammaproteobacteria bacterium]